MNKMPQMDEFQVDRFADGMDAAWSNLVELAKMISVNKAAGTLTIRNGRSKIVLRQDGVIRVEGTSIVQTAERNIALDAGTIDLN